MSSRPRDPGDFSIRAANALLWVGSFAFAVAIFLCARRLLVWIPLTAPDAVGRVTIEGASKMRDYVTAALFYLVAGIGTPLIAIGLRRLHDRSLGFGGTATRRFEAPSLALFSVPFLISPFFYLTTRKEGWALLLPFVLSLAAPWSFRAWSRRRWIRELFQPALFAANGLLITEGFAWILARYIGIGKRIAHIPTLFLEIAFLLFFLAAFWCAAVLICRIASLSSGRSVDRLLPRFAIGATPLLALPPMLLSLRTGSGAVGIVVGITAITVVLALRSEIDPRPRTLRLWTALAAVPMLLFVFSFASTAMLSRWVDLFHRGESLGPASDYLRGKIPYRDVFVLHGMLEDGLLDSWLMNLFGRGYEVAAMRMEILSALVLPAFWYLGLALFRSMPLALATVAVGMVTSSDNQRGLLAIVAVTLLVVAITRRRQLPLVLSGAVAGVALFVSLEIGIYSIAGGFATLVVLAFLERYQPAQPNAIAGRRSLLTFGGGVIAGTAPFLVYLAVRGAIGAFFETSFRTVPSIIDSVWSLPFPDLTSAFGTDLTLRSISDFVLGSQMRFVLNPLVIGIALAVVAAMVYSRRVTDDTRTLLALAIVAGLTQRSALGRADFPHQYFSAFLIAPIAVILAVLLARRVVPLWHLGAGSRTAIVVAACALLPAAVVALWIPDLLNAKLDDVIRYRPRVSRIGFSDPVGDESEERIRALRSAIDKLVPPGHPIFDFSNQPALYFFADRPNPTRFYQVPVLSPPAFQVEAIRDLEISKPRLVLRRSPDGFDRFDGVTNDMRAAALAHYLDERYQYLRNVRGVELWIRKPGGRRIEYSHFVTIAKRIPPRTVDHGDQVVFPAVGSVRGAASSYWRSDLLVDNRSDRPAALRMRYLSADGNRERRVIAPPARLLSIPDVVRNLFAAPDSRGALWVECDGDCPLMRIRTWDTTHAGAEPAYEPPLQVSQSAEGGSDHDELVIIGAVGTRTRRVNVGVINTGIRPLKYSVALVDRDGNVVGTTLHSSVDEGGTELFVDAASRFGVPVDGSKVIRIRLESGRALAYAGIVDGLTGDQNFIPAVRTGGS
ncbi:MAG: hypothetical protein WBX15_18435 [Thermoanaerobaculia bacterium]